MTIDEAKTVFLNRGYIEVEGGTIYDADKWRESCRVISEWLEQEPSGNTVSRQAVQEAITLSIELKENPHQIWKRIQNLPSAEKTGHWIDGKCDKCGNHAPYLAIAASTYFINYTDYCPKCGARMESEGNERDSD